MLRLTYIRCCLTGVMLTLVLLGIVLARAPEAALAQRPNFVVIQTDDQNADTLKSFYRGRGGEVRRVMPNTLDGIVRSGAEFNNYYASSPVCSPSRASLLTGQYPHSNGLLRNDGREGGWSGWQALPTWHRNVPVTLNRAGYHTAHFGKLINDYYDTVNRRVDRTVPLGWDRWFTTAFVPGARYYGYEVNDDGVGIGPIGNPRYRLGGPGVDPATCTAARLLSGPGRKRCKHLTDFMTRAAVREIRHRRSRPFYLQIDYQSPHGDVRPPAGPTPQTRHAGTAANTPLPRPPNFNEADFSDKPAFIRESAGRPMNRREIRKQTHYYRRYIEALRGVDDGVGAILKTLRQTGQLRNTYVFFLSDHGMFLGEHRFDRAKFLPYEAASSVAMAVRGPGISAGTKVNEVVGNIDIPATVLQLSGATSGYELDGRPLGRFWRNPETRTRRPFEVSLFVGDNASAGVSGDASVSSKAPAVNYRGYRVGPYKYIRYRNGARELYDLKRDPHELNNRIDKPRYDEVQRYMARHLDEVISCHGEACRRELPPWPLPSR
ncbi:MAG: sulfatase [Actinomycetota bacterium]|nr:sulfatase [Actinomycetota bacterium]